MPKVHIEIMRTVTVTREETAVVELDVPQSVLDGEDGEELVSWIDEIMGDDESAVPPRKRMILRVAVDGADWDVDEDEDIEYTEANWIT